jgi:type IV secretory pathway TrbD component
MGVCAEARIHKLAYLEQSIELSNTLSVYTSICSSTTFRHTTYKKNRRSFRFGWLSWVAGAGFEPAAFRLWLLATMSYRDQAKAKPLRQSTKSRPCQRPKQNDLVAGAGFEPAAFRLWLLATMSYRDQAKAKPLRQSTKSRPCQRPKQNDLVAGAGFEPAAFRL